MKSLEFKSQAKSDYARKSDVSSIPHVPSTLKFFFALSTEINEAPNYNFQRLTDF